MRLRRRAAGAAAAVAYKPGGTGLAHTLRPHRPARHRRRGGGHHAEGRHVWPLYSARAVWPRPDADAGDGVAAAPAAPERRDFLRPDED